MENFYKRVGELIIGTRLKRISDKFLTDVANIYKKLHIPFEVSWFPIFYLLNEKGKLSVTEISKELEITHSAVSQMIAVLDKRGMIKFIDDKDDKRRRFICFTARGQKLMSTLPPIWEAMQHCMQEIFSEGVNSTHILSALNEVEESLGKESLTSRVVKELEKGGLSDVEIIDYDDSCYKCYKDFALRWLIDKNSIDMEGVDFINNPRKAVHEQNTTILMAKENTDCVGAIVYRTVKNNEIKIIFFVTDDKWKSKQMGKKLLNEVLNRAGTMKINRISITLSRANSELIKILKDAGFVLYALDDKRNATDNSADLIMQYNLK
ncbi:MAG: GNAT family N-acetyltransferase [bacterium]